MTLMITIIMITVHTTPIIVPTTAPIMASLLLLSQESQAVVHNYKIMYTRTYISSYVCSYIYTYLQLSTEISCKS